MAFSQETLDAIRGTWAMAAADQGRTAQVFYANLFRRDPSTKPLFVGDLELQGRKLTQTLNFIVDHLDQLDILLPAAEDLARRHMAYNVAEPQYASVGAALIATFQQLLGPAFTAEHEAAWAEAYGALSGHMTKTAYGTAS